MNCSCSQIGNPEMMLVANGFLTHYNFETLIHLTCNENSFCKAPNFNEKFLLASVSLLGHHLSKVGNM
jgi:hypothetical protein